MRTLALTLLLAPASAFAVDLDIAGSCPGRIAMDGTNITPGASVAVISSTGPGSTIIPAGPCAGTELPLTGVQLRTIVSDSDGDGIVSLRPNIPGAACGQRVSFVDLSACEVSEAPTLGGDPVSFVGYAVWTQSTPVQSDADQDQLMQDACDASFPGTHPATVENFALGQIAGLPTSTNESGFWLVPASPDGAGQTSIGALEGHCRVCVTPGAAWPTDWWPEDGSWEPNCCTNDRSAACVN